MKFGIVLLWMSILLVGCSNEDASVDPISNPEPKLVQTSSEMTLSGVLVVSTWTYNGNKLHQITDDLGNVRTFHYDGNRIVAVDWINEFGELVRYEYEYDTAGRIVASYDITGPWGRKEIYDYQPDGSVRIQQFSGSNTLQDQLMATIVMEIQDGEVVRNTTTQAYDNSTSVYEYEYDNNSSPTRNILGYDKIAGLFNYSHRGILKNTVRATRHEYGTTVVVDKSYRYDSDGYPVEVNSSDPLDGDTYTIRYKY